jgi:hypothetical protein
VAGIILSARVAIVLIFAAASRPIQQKHRFVSQRSGQALHLAASDSRAWQRFLVVHGKFEMLGT